MREKKLYPLEKCEACGKIFIRRWDSQKHCNRVCARRAQYRRKLEKLGAGQHNS